VTEHPKEQRRQEEPRSIAKLTTEIVVNGGGMRDVTGLEPDRWYYYRFIAGGEARPIGRTRIFPPIGSPADRLRFAFASYQHYGPGYFTAYVHAPIRGCTARWLSTLATPGTRSAARRSALPSSRVATMPQRCTAPSRITMLT
jgi:hypothetical protein